MFGFRNAWALLGHDGLGLSNDRSARPIAGAVTHQGARFRQASYVLFDSPVGPPSDSAARLASSSPGDAIGSLALLLAIASMRAELPMGKASIMHASLRI